VPQVCNSTFIQLTSFLTNSNRLLCHVA